MKCTSDTIQKLLQQSILHYKRGDYCKSLAVCEQACRLAPESADAQYVLGSSLQALKNNAAARTAYRRAAELDPQHTNALCSLGILEQAAGDGTAAMRCFQEALASKPDDAQAHYGIATLLCERKLHTDAAEHLRAAIRSRPDVITFHNLLGLTLQNSGDMPGAIEALGQTLELDAHQPVLHLNMGNALSRLQQFDAAITHYQRAIALNPEFAAAHYRLGIAYQGKGQMDRALASYRTASDLNPTLYGAIAGMADILVFQGDKDAAFALLAPLVEQGVANVNIACVFSELCYETGNCGQAEALLLRLLEDATLSVPDKAQVHFSLGRLLDRSGAYAAAFPHISTANATKADRDGHERELRRTRAIIDVFSRDYLAAAPRAPVTAQVPVFIVGMPRSGTSLVEQILASHPEIAGLGELMLVNEMAANLGALTGSDIAYPYSARGLDYDTLAALSAGYLQKTAARAGSAACTTDKMPHNFLNLGLIQMLFPNARIIHCSRDARDTCLSCYLQDFGPAHPYSYDLGFLADYYNHYLELMRHWRQTLSIPIFEVRYEQLVHEQEQTSRALLNYCGLEWNEKCLFFYRNPREVATASHSQVRRPMYTSSIGKWRHYQPFLAPLLETLQAD